MSAGSTVTLPRLSEDELRTVVASYVDVAERLRESHERLQIEVKRLHADLDAKNRELARRDRLAALGQMAAGLAHEIRNPLGGILLYASMLEKDLADRPAQRDVATRISVAVRTMEGLVSDILAFAGRSEPKRVNTTLGRIIDDAVAFVSAKLGEARSRLSIDDRLSAIGLFADELQLRSAMSNLLLNACEAAGAGGAVSVQLVSEPTARRVRFSVADNGAGIPPEMIDRIFDPFFTSKASGTGLGLAIVHRVVECHGGRVWACNRPAGGAEFVMELPVRSEQPNCAATNDSSPQEQDEGAFEESTAWHTFA